MNLGELTKKHKVALMVGSAVVGLILLWVFYQNSSASGAPTSTSDVVPGATTDTTGATGTGGVDYGSAINSLAQQQATEEQALAYLQTGQQQTQGAVSALMGLMSTTSAPTTSSVPSGSVATQTSRTTPDILPQPTPPKVVAPTVVTGRAASTIATQTIKATRAQPQPVKVTPTVALVGTVHDTFAPPIQLARTGSTYVPSTPNVQTVSKPVARTLGNVGAGNANATGYHKVAVPVNTRPGMHNAPNYKLVKNG